MKRKNERKKHPKHGHRAGTPVIVQAGDYAAALHRHGQVTLLRDGQALVVAQDVGGHLCATLVATERHYSISQTPEGLLLLLVGDGTSVRQQKQFILDADGLVEGLASIPRL